MDKAGHRIVHPQYFKSALQHIDRSTLAAVVVDWRSKRSQAVIEEAKASGVPVLVITSRLAAAVDAGNVKADLYVEKPATNDEICAMLADLITVKNKPAAAAAANIA